MVGGPFLQRSRLALAWERHIDGKPRLRDGNRIGHRGKHGLLSRSVARVVQRDADDETLSAVCGEPCPGGRLRGTYATQARRHCAEKPGRLCGRTAEADP